MNLQDKLDAKRREFEAAAPKEVQAVMHRAMEDLVRSGIVARAKGVGDSAPDFALPNQGGDTVTLGDMLSRGPAVVGFYRGRW